MFNYDIFIVINEIINAEKLRVPWLGCATMGHPVPKA